MPFRFAPQSWFGKEVRLLASRNPQMGVVRKQGHSLKLASLLRAPLPTRRRGHSEPKCRKQTITGEKTQSLEMDKLRF